MKRAECTIDGCNKAAIARGWCRAHWSRWRRHGDPSAGRTAHHEPRSFIETIALQWPDDGTCLSWPYGQAGNGYGKIHYGRKNQFAHRVVCELAHGSPPSARHYAAHSCGNGHLGCVNPHHLSWKTPAENSADQKTHGTVNRGSRNGTAKLSPEQVLEIRRLAGSRPKTEIGTMFGVSRATVSDIQRHRRWGWLEQDPNHVS